MEFISETLQQYLTDHSDAEPQILKELNRETHLKILQPRMLSGAYQGRLLAMLSRMVNPSRILEVGTYTGYSALCLAEGMDEGEIVTLEVNEELESIAGRYFDRFRENVNSNIQFTQKIGDATEIIPTLEGSFDLVFLDADKQNYPTYLEQVLSLCQNGSVILSDNVLWSGKVLKEVDEDDEQTRALVHFNELLANHERLNTVMLPVRDGLTISWVK